MAINELFRKFERKIFQLSFLKRLLLIIKKIKFLQLVDKALKNIFFILLVDKSIERILTNNLERVEDVVPLMTKHWQVKIRIKNLKHEIL